MEEYEVYYGILIKNGFRLEDEYSHGGATDERINYLKFIYDVQIFSSQKYIDSRVYFNFATGDVTYFQLHAPNDITEKVNRELKIALREYKISSIIGD